MRFSFVSCTMAQSAVTSEYISFSYTNMSFLNCNLKLLSAHEITLQIYSFLKIFDLSINQLYLRRLDGKQITQLDMHFLLQKYHFVMKNSINLNLKLSTFLYLYVYRTFFLEETESVLKWPPLLSPPIIDKEKNIPCICALKIQFFKVYSFWRMNIV